MNLRKIKYTSPISNQIAQRSFTCKASNVSCALLYFTEMNDDQHDLFSQMSSSSSITSDDRLQTVSHEYIREQQLSQLELNEDPDLFLQPSGFGANEDEEEGVDEMEESEVDDTKIDDTVRENAAISVYQDTHPDCEQRFVGGREIAEHEAIWSVSSFRPHWGPDKLRDNNALTYWQ